MTVKELIEALQKLPQDVKVYTEQGIVESAELWTDGAVMLLDDYYPDPFD